MESRKLKIMMSTEGTFPFHRGGVSTWCNMLVSQLSEFDFIIYSIVSNPFLSLKYEINSNTALKMVPLWGTEEPEEFTDKPFSAFYKAKSETGEKVIKEKFIPLLNDLVDEIISIEKNLEKFGTTLLELYRYFQCHDYKSSFKSSKTWEFYKTRLNALAANRDLEITTPDVYSLVQSLAWLFRFLQILNITIPDADVSHSSAAAFCGVPCVIAKLENGTPYLLTEHGVYLREQYLSMSLRQYGSFLNTFLIRFIQSVSTLSYKYADQVSPVCGYNTRWETRLGVDPQKIKVIYNGVDERKFAPPESRQRNKYPTVVTMARIDPIKDIVTLIKAASIVKTRIPDVRFIVYGAVSSPAYMEECKTLRDQLVLKENFIFAGHTDDVPKALAGGDIVALTSISEGFPYSLIEAMMAGKAIIATDVGGVREALGDSGVIVNPRSPEEVARSIIYLIHNPAAREELEKKARERALEYFTLDRGVSMYRESYINLARSSAEKIQT